MVVGGELRLHDAVTGLAAKLHGLREMVGLVAAEGRHQQEHHRARSEEQEVMAVARPREIDGQRMGFAALGRLRGLAVLHPPPGNNQRQSQNQEGGGDDVGQDAEVGVAIAREGVDRDQKDEREQTPQGDDRPGQAQPVLEVRGWLPGRGGGRGGHGESQFRFRRNASGNPSKNSPAGEPAGRVLVLRQAGRVAARQPGITSSSSGYRRRDR